MKQWTAPDCIPLVSPTDANASLARLFDVGGSTPLRIDLNIERHKPRTGPLLPMSVLAR